MWLSVLVKISFLSFKLLWSIPNNFTSETLLAFSSVKFLKLERFLSQKKTNFSFKIHSDLLNADMEKANFHNAVIGKSVYHPRNI